VTIAKVFIKYERQEFMSSILMAYKIVLPTYIDYDNFLPGIILSTLAGFLIFLISRFVAEFIRAIAAIANNTKTIN
jgi:hypothetical protein